jgi:hypothetical protein
MGFGTNRVVSKGLNKTGLTTNQLKGMNTLQNICGVKKTENKTEDVVKKITDITTMKKIDDLPAKNRLMADLDDSIKPAEESKSSEKGEKEKKIETTEEPKVITISKKEETAPKAAAKKPGFSLKSLI